MDVGVISYNTCADLQRCLESLRVDSAEVFVVDNASTDGSVEMVRNEFQHVRLIANDDNRGYAAAANQVLDASADDVLLLNADTVVDPRVLAVLREYLDRHPDVGVVAPRLLNPDGTRQPSCYPFLTPVGVLVAMTLLNDVVGRLPWLRRRVLHACSPVGSQPVPWAKGAALGVRRTAWSSVGGFDESYFMYGEEMDFAYRLALRGWATHFTPAASVVHIERASSPGKNAVVEGQIFRSLVRFYRHHYSRSRLTQLRLVLFALMALRAARDGALLAITSDKNRRSELREMVAVWIRVASGRKTGAPTLGP